MIKMHSTKRALVASILVLALCLSSLIGTTFAWFTDSVTSENNIIKSGNLDITLEYWDGDSWENVSGAADILAGDKWEPGYVDVAYLRITNAGSLALKYALGVNIVTETPATNVNEEVFYLSSFIYYDVFEGINGETASFKTREEAMAETSELFLIKDGYSAADSLNSGDVSYLAMVVYMPETVGNEANHNGTAPEINLGINVFATQMTYEKDSFGDDYDATAPWTGMIDISWYLQNPTATEYVLETPEQLAGLAAIVNGTATNDMMRSASNAIPADDFAGKTIILAKDLDLNNIAWTPIGSGDNSFKGTFEGNGNSIINVNLVANDEATALFGEAEEAIIKNVTAVSGEGENAVSAPIAPEGTKVYNSISSWKNYTDNRKSGDFILEADLNAENIIHFGNGTTVSLNLNGKTVTAENVGQYIIGAQQGASLVLEGKGVVNAGKGFMTNKGGAEIVINGGTYNTTVTSTLNNIKHASLAQNNSKIVINGGTFTTNVEDAVLFFATSNATVEVNGGFFENTADETPDLFSMGTNKSNTNRIIFKGGTFVNWNPLEDRMCYTGEWPASYENFSGPWMLVWDGYTVVSETQANGDVWYTVVKAN